MSDGKDSSDVVTSNPAPVEALFSKNSSYPREALITTAVNFLQNAKVRHTTLMQKQQFLKSKGLTNKEIQLACERAGVFTTDPSATVINMDIKTTQTQTHLALQPRKSSTLDRIKKFIHSITLLGGVAYAVYLFWKKFLEPFLFGAIKKKKSIDDSLMDLNRKVDGCVAELKSDLIQVKEALGREQRDQTVKFIREFTQFRNDLEAIKGLLLNRKQFAAPTNLGAPSIPAWQLSSSSPHNTRHHSNSQSDDNEKLDDAGSGSGSSETEVVTKNSDSSLELV